MLRSAIVVPLDGTALGETAIEHALALLEPEEELVLLRVRALRLDLESSYALTDCSEEECVTYLDSLAAGLRSRVAGLRCVVRTGNPEDSIVEVSGQERARLLVLATHGRTGLFRWARGSVAEHVARRAPCPVWVVREGHRVEPRERLLVPLDTTAQAEESLALARNLRAPQGKLLLLTALAGLASLPSSEPEAAAEPVERTVRRYLDVMLERLRQVGVRAESVVAENVPPAEAIVRAASAEQANAIVMTSHGRDGLSRWLLGSVAESVVRQSPCPVLLVGPGWLAASAPATPAVNAGSEGS